MRLDCLRKTFSARLQVVTSLEHRHDATTAALGLAGHLNDLSNVE